MAQELARKLEANGQCPILVWHGERFEQINQDQFCIRLGNELDMSALFTGLIGQPLQGVVHLWSLDMPVEFQFDQNLGPASILHLVQSLGQPTPRLWLATQGARQVQGIGLDQPKEVQQSMAWGLGRVIAQEYPGLHCVCLDLDPSAHAESAAHQLITELGEDNTKQQEDLVAWRQNERYVARLVATSLDPTLQPATTQPVRDDASYLITGGLGALGLQIAQSLLIGGARHLVLCGRSGATGKEEALEALQKQGAQLLVIQADVTDSDDVTRIMKTIEDQAPPLRGIIHAAGVLDDGVLRQQTVERFERVLKPKVQGAWNLHLHTLDMQLDFFVCFSSVASLLGNPGQGNYATANAFLDALAHHRRTLGLPGQSINWGPWAESGMAADDETLNRLASLGMAAFSGSEGIDLFHSLSRSKFQVLRENSG
ncbi:SDR family NAD(P)-dependent oxidoreductase [Chloroflexi bacterium TSY]|nr:SDR family NAD(P)-dependent oxidoreductase [Chloroflexi bacterium TSY]